ncbi:MAG: hypothetical protein ACJ8DI_22880 [Ktedonobacteraceae bacterium]
MTEQRTREGGSAISVLTDTHDPLSDGHIPGSLAFYDERHRPSFPPLQPGDL